MPKFYPLKVKTIRRETADCVSLAFEVPDDLKPEYQFIQGQHLTLKTQIEGKEVRRSYSICTSPVDEELRVAVKRQEGGKFSTFANEELSEGDVLDVMTPMGSFHTEMDQNNEKHYAAFAAGSGITPVISILRSVLKIEPKSQFTLFYGNRAADSILFKEEIEGLKNRYLGRLSVYHILSREQPEIPLFHGRITAEKCRAFCDKLLDVNEVDEFFLCGPEPMIRAVKETLLSLGTDEKMIHFELFTSPAGPLGRSKRKKRTSQPPIISKIKITLDGATFEFDLTSDGDTILEAAMKGGADLPFACKGGVCCTCKAKLLQGEVEMDVHYGLEAEEVKAGYILTCQSHPKTAQVVVSFDE